MVFTMPYNFSKIANKYLLADQILKATKHKYPKWSLYRLQPKGSL